jgi:hypothetical protein
MSVKLASYQRCVERIRCAWPSFQHTRSQWLQQHVRHGSVAEKVAENILQDLFTQVLDWSVADLNHQIDYADIELTSHGIKRLLVEVKRPGALAWHRSAVERALDQARRYADQQRVKTIAVSDGFALYAADIVQGGLRDRVFVRLDDPTPPEDLWWLSVHGIYRERPEVSGIAFQVLAPLPSAEPPSASAEAGTLLHPKYKLPVSCFAYVGNADRPSTWRLPYRLIDGSVDEKRLPKAIQAILSNYRGAQVSGIPENDIPAVLRRLRDAAAEKGRLPGQTGNPAPVYQLLHEALRQIDE